MKDVIKEILEFKENADYKRLSVDEILVLRDYITVLKEQNKTLQLDLIKMNDLIIDSYMELNKKQQRINKSLEYVYYLGLKCKYRLNSGHLRKLKKLLQGSDKDDK